jgi:putative alpha-1,2-mannosidase
MTSSSSFCNYDYDCSWEGDIVEGWLNAYKEGGWLPAWASPGYRNCMVGTFADVVVSDAIVKNIGGFDLEVARMALKKDAFEEPPSYAGNAIGKKDNYIVDIFNNANIHPQLLSLWH